MIKAFLEGLGAAAMFALRPVFMVFELIGLAILIPADRVFTWLIAAADEERHGERSNELFRIAASCVVLPIMTAVAWYAWLWLAVLKFNFDLIISRYAGGALW